MSGTLPSTGGTISLACDPMSQVLSVGSAADGRWIAYGQDPSFRCRWPGDGPIRGGWYEVTFDVEVLKGKIHEPCLYPDYGTGYAIEEDRLVLPLRDATAGRHTVSWLVRLHLDVVAMRFDPSVLPAEFRFGGLRLRRVDRVPAAVAMFRGMMAKTPWWRRPVRVAAMLFDMLVGGPTRMADRMYHAYAERTDNTVASNYGLWTSLYDVPAQEDLELYARAADELGRRRTFSVVLPTYNTDERWLRRCIDSVRAQVYPHWELCIADDASTAPHVRRVLEEYAALDARIRLAFRERNGHISEASNTALGLASGEFVALLDHDDELSPLALLECAKALDANPGWRMLFTDEDKIDEGGARSDPYFKSDWNPDLFLAQNCVCHLGVYARSLVEEVGGFRPGFEGAQDWDLTLRITARLAPAEIGHVPRVLYHWRMIQGSTALNPGEKNYAHLAGLRAIQSHLDQTAPGAKVLELPGYSGYYRTRYPLPDPQPLVSLLVPTRDGVRLLRQCVDSILRRTDYDNLEIIILDNGSREEATLAYFDSLRGHPKVRVAPIDRDFNFSAINNHGASLARGEVIGLVNNDIEVIGRDWLREMVSHAMRPEIGAVGAMLYYPNDTIQHAGVVLGIGGVAGHSYVGHRRGHAGDKHRAGLVQNVSAVTAACLVVRASVFHEVGGLDEALVVAFNDIDFCLRVREAGYRNLWTPFAELYHHESATRGYENTPEKIARFKREEAFMKARWGRALESDPYYNPNFALDAAPWTLAFPPRNWSVSTIGDFQ